MPFRGSESSLRLEHHSCSWVILKCIEGLIATLHSLGYMGLPVSSIMPLIKMVMLSLLICRWEVPQVCVPRKSTL